MLWRRKWQPTPVFLPGESQGRGSLVGCRLWRHTESDTTEAMQQQQQHNSSVTPSWQALCDSKACSTPVFLVLHQLQEFAQTHVHQVSDATLPSHCLSSPSPPAFNLSQSFPMSAAASAAESLQSCPTLCDPIDGSPPGSPVPGILQARTPEWVAISFSKA